jgi:hypothetical protein
VNAVPGFLSASGLTTFDIYFYSVVKMTVEPETSYSAAVRKEEGEEVKLGLKQKQNRKGSGRDSKMISFANHL